MLSEIYVHLPTAVFTDARFSAIDTVDVGVGSFLAFANREFPYHFTADQFVCGKIIRMDEVCLLPAVRIAYPNDTKVRVIPARSIVIDAIGMESPVTRIPKNRSGETVSRDLFTFDPTIPFDQRKKGKMNQIPLDLHFPSIPYNFTKLTVETEAKYLHVVGGVHLVPKYDI